MQRKRKNKNNAQRSSFIKETMIISMCTEKPGKSLHDFERKTMGN